MTSLEYFHPEFMSLTSAHPIWTSTGPSPAKVAMASVQAKFLSGRYRTQALCSHWLPNKDTKCRLSPLCDTDEETTHMLKDCHALLCFTQSYCSDHPIISELAIMFCSSKNPDFCQFLLDCSTIPEVIKLFQQHGPVIHHHLFNITRIWCYSLHETT